MFRVLLDHHREYNNCIKLLLDAKQLLYTIIVLPDYVPLRPKYGGVSGVK
jgi:hypothetical protein